MDKKLIYLKLFEINNIKDTFEWVKNEEFQINDEENLWQGENKRLIPLGNGKVNLKNMLTKLE